MGNEATRFKPGEGGRPKGAVSGRTKALCILDSVLNEVSIQKELKLKLRQYIMKDAVMAFKTLIMPLLPKDVNLHGDLEIDIDFTASEVRRRLAALVGEPGDTEAVTDE